MAKMEKLKHQDGSTIYPATVTDAVVNPTNRKPLTQELSEKQLKVDAVGKKTPEGGEVFNDYKGNKAGNTSSAFGGGNDARGEYNFVCGQYNEASPSAGEQFVSGFRNKTTNYFESTRGTYNKSNKGTIDSVGIGNSVNRKNATETMKDGKHYILGVGEYDGTNSVDPNASGVKATDVASVVKHDHEVRDFVRHGMSTVNPQVTLPKWFMDSLVCWYDPARQGLKNEDIHAGEPFLLKDFSNNGLDMTMHGFQGAGMSGMDGYGASGEKIFTSFADVVKVGERYNITNIIKNDWTIVYNQRENEIIKFRISGIESIAPNGFITIAYFSSNGGEKNIKITQNGIYTIEKEQSTDKRIIFSTYNFTGACDITIEQLPIYEGALVFDGVDDYGVNKNQPILTDYTVFAEREWIRLPNGTNNVGFAAKRTRQGEGAFTLDRSDSSNFIFTRSFGGYSNVSANFDKRIVVQTKKSYNGFTIKEGTDKDNNLLVFGRAFADAPSEPYSKFALSSFILFNRTLTPEEIDYVKRNVLKEEERDLPQRVETIENETNPNDKLPKWYQEALVCHYSPAKQELKNGIDIIDGKPFTLKDFSKNHLDMTMHGFQGSGMSGMDGYVVTFNKLPIVQSVAKLSATNNKINITEVISDAFFIYDRGNETTKEVESYKISVSGLPNSATLKYSYLNEVGNRMFYDITKDGKYVLPKSRAVDYSQTSIGFKIAGFTGACNITIEQLPIYEGALVFDGVDDYGVNKNQPTLDNGYTIICNREILSWNGATSAVATKASKNTWDGAFTFERQSACFNYGSQTSINVNKNKSISVQTNKMYNGKQIDGNIDRDTTYLGIGRAPLTSGVYIQFALYDFLLFNRSLTPDEIDWVKNNVIGNGEVKNEAIETKEGKAYINGVGGFNGDATKATDLAYIINQMQCLLKNRPIAIWNAKGRSNGEPEAMRNILPDLSGNGHNITLHGFAFKGTSGYGGYTNFSFLSSRGTAEHLGTQTWQIRSLTDNTPITVSKESFNAFDQYFYINISGLLEGEKIQIGGEGYKGNGRHKIMIPSTYSESYVSLVFGLSSMTDRNILIDIEPLYPDALVFDGTDDYGFCENMPLFNPKRGYTIIAKRKREDGNNGYICTKSSLSSIGAFAFERDKKTSDFSSFYDIQNERGDIVFQNSKTYNGTTEFPSYSTTRDYQNIYIGTIRPSWSTLFKGAIYEIHVFDHNLTPEEIEMYIRWNIDPNYTLPE